MWSNFLLITLMAFGLIGPVVPTIPSSATLENSYDIPTGHLCMTGEDFHTLSDDVYGTHTGQGVYNEYVVTISGYGGYDFFRVSLTILNCQPGDKVIIKIAEIDDPAGTTVSCYYHVDTPIYKLPSGDYTVIVGYLKVANAPASYRINMG